MKPKFEMRKAFCCMHCDRKKKADVLVRYLDSLGYHWSDGEDYVDHDTGKTNPDWSIYKQHTVYYFNIGKLANTAFAHEHNHTILEFDDFDWE